MPNGYHWSREGWIELEAPFVDPIRRSVWIVLTDAEGAQYDMGATASSDRERKRFFRTEPLEQGVMWPEIHDHLEELLEYGFVLANSWSEADIPYALDLPRL